MMAVRGSAGGGDIISNYGAIAGAVTLAMAADLGAGGDTLVNAGTICGAVLMGADMFVVASVADAGMGAGRDAITGFAVGTDDMRMIFMRSFIGGAGLTAAGQVRFNSVTDLLAGNTDADAAAEWTVQMATGLVMTSGDFVF